MASKPGADLKQQEKAITITKTQEEAKAWPFRRSAEVKSVFISVDNRSVPFKPLHSAWKAKSFTDGDIVLHFCILDLLAEGAVLVSG